MNTKPTLYLLLAAGFSLATSAVAERNYLSWGFRHDINALTTTQRGVAVAMDRRGYVAATGYNDVANDTWYTARYDSLTGVPLWQKTFSNGVGDDRPIAIVTDSQGNVIVGGFSSSQNQRDFYTIKYAALTGNVIWQRRYNNNAQNGNDEITAMAVDAFDNVIVTGKSFDSGKQEDFYTIKYNGANGNELWAKRYGASFPDKPNALAVAANGDVVVVGSSRVGSNLCYLTIRYSASNGDLHWAQTFDSNQNDDDEATGVAVAADGSVLVTGLVRMIGATYAYHTIKYPAAGGSAVWTRTYQAPGGNNKTPPFIGVNSTGDALISGTANLDNFRTVYYAAKYQASNGALIWENATNAPQGSPANTLVNDQVSDMVVDNEGNVIVTGKSYLPATDNDLLTVKFRAKDGRLLWQQRLNGDADKGIDTAAGVAVDAAGDVAVTGTTDKGNQNNYYQMVTVRYKRFLLSVGDPVSGPGLSTAASISGLTAPATFEDGSIVTRITVKDGAKSYGAILPTTISGNTVSALQGQPAPGVPNGKFAVFNHPVCSPNGSYAFVASMTGVPSAEKTGVWTTGYNGNLQLALQGNKQVPGLDAGILLKSVVNLSQGNGYLAALIDLKGTGVTKANARALVSLTSPVAGTEVMRTGRSYGVDGKSSTVTAISIFTPPAAAAGHGRYLGATRLVAKLTLADKRSVLVSLTNTGTLHFHPATGGAADAVAMGGKWKTLNQPAIATNGAHLAAQVTLQTGVGGVTASNDSAIVFAPNVNTAFDDLVVEGGTAPGVTNGIFASFKDPVSNNMGRYAFLATVKGQGVTAANQTGLWCGTPGALVLMARTGSLAPDAYGAETNRKYAALKSIALPGGASSGPLFLATLSGAGVSTANNSALFGLDGDGYMRQLLRRGDKLGASTLKTFSVLTPVPLAQSASRSFNNNGSITALLTFTNHPTAIVRIGLP